MCVCVCVSSYRCVLVYACVYVALLFPRVVLSLYIDTNICKQPNVLGEGLSAGGKTPGKTFKDTINCTEENT